jgi:hypothetical protein
MNKNMAANVEERRLVAEVDHGRLAMLVRILGFICAKKKIPGSVPLLDQLGAAQGYSVWRRLFSTTVVPDTGNRERERICIILHRQRLALLLAMNSFGNGTGGRNHGSVARLLVLY